MQNLHPIAYFSKTLSDRNLAKSTYECEIMALALAVQHWRPYLLGSKFTMFTNQKSLGYLPHRRFTTLDQQHWVVKLLGFNFDINYKQGCRCIIPTGRRLLPLLLVLLNMGRRVPPSLRGQPRPCSSKNKSSFTS